MQITKTLWMLAYQTGEVGRLVPMYAEDEMNREHGYKRIVGRHSTR